MVIKHHMSELPETFDDRVAGYAGYESYPGALYIVLSEHAAFQQYTIVDIGNGNMVGNVYVRVEYSACNCGSGYPNTTCPNGDPYCG